jgi:hypothetical protein
MCLALQSTSPTGAIGATKGGISEDMNEAQVLVRLLKHIEGEKVSNIGPHLEFI